MSRLPAFDLETTYLGLDGKGEVTVMPVGPDFWPTIESNPNARGTMVSAYGGEGDWPHWEMHPNGDEVLVLMAGELTMLFDGPTGTSENRMTAGSTLIVPAGVWHVARGQRGVKLLAITYGAGTTHRPA